MIPSNRVEQNALIINGGSSVSGGICLLSVIIMSIISTTFIDFHFIFE